VKKLLLFTLSIVLIVGLALVSCAQEEAAPVTPAPTTAPATTPAPTSTPAPSAAPAPTPAPAPSTAETPKLGGVLKIISGGGPVAFGYPPGSQPFDFWGGFGILEALIGVDGQGEPTPLLATSWDLAADGKSVTFNLRKGVKFHDDTPFNAQAVKWSVDKFIEAHVISTVSSIDVIDDYTVRFNLPQFNNAVYTQISDLTYISPTAAEKNGIDWAKTHAVGTGPFMQKEFIRDVSITKVKFPDYWDTGKPYLDGMLNVFIPDPTTAKMSFEAGEAHILMIGSDGKVAKELADKGFVVRGMPGMASFLATDSVNADSPFYSAKVRMALEYAINKKQITDTVGQGYMDPLDQICPPGMVGNNPGIKERAYDPAMAKQLLAEAGYPDGFETKLMALQGFTSSDIVTAVQGYMKDVGIDVAVDLMDMGRGFQTMFQGWRNGMMFAGTGLDPNMCQRLSADLSASSPYNPCLKKPDSWQTTLDQALAARDVATRDKYLQQMMQINYDEEMVVPLWALYDTAALQPSVHCDLLLYHHIKWNPAGAWIDK
jgi:peptide/nickel transport system substrate-binding protein